MAEEAEIPEEAAEDTDATEITDDGDAEGEGEGKKGLGRKKLILMIAVPVLVLLLGGGGAAFFLMGGDPATDQTAAEDGAGGVSADPSGGSDEQAAGASNGDTPEEEGSKRPEGASVFYAASGLVFYDLPDMIVNLNSSGRQSRYLKIKVALEFGDPKVVDQIETVMPRIVDHFQVYLRELREDDLRGSAGLYRLKEELMIRVNQALRPAKIRDVLFKEMLVQ